MPASSVPELYEYGAAIASDPRGQGVMLFGGIGVPSANVTGCLTWFQTRHLNDTWTYGTGCGRGDDATT